jgi:hypothetical protein
MGWCSAGSSGEPCDPETCQQINGDYSDKPRGPIGCLLLSALEDERAVLMASTLLYPPLFAFRDDVLARTTLGQRMLDHFRTHYEEAKKILQEDDDLVTDLIWALEYVLPYIRAMLGEDLSPGRNGYTPTTYVAEQLRPQTADFLVFVVDRFAEKASPAFTEAIDDFKKNLSHFIDLKPEAAFVELRREDVAVSQ